MTGPTYDPALTDLAGRPHGAQRPKRPTSFAADIPPEPTALRSFRDRDGDLWELNTEALRDGQNTRWRCMTAKVPAIVMGGARRDAPWLWVITNVGPLTPVEWAEDASADG